MAVSSPSSRSAFPGQFWEAPLVWVALAWTAGIVVDRHFSVNLWASLTIVAAALAVWLGAIRGQDHRLPAFFLGCAIAGAGMMHHHLATRRILENDVSRFVTEEPEPAKLWGRVYAEPIVVRATSDPLQSFAGQDSLHFVLEVEACELSGNAPSASGLVQVTAPAKSPELHVGDRVRVLGHLARPASRANPGDFDYAGILRDQGIRTVLHVPGAVVLEEIGWRKSFFGWLGALQTWGRRMLKDTMPKEPRERLGVAEALLLGEGSSMTSSDWDKYLRSGVLHVLAVSGQHLVVLAAFLHVLLRLARLRMRTRGVLITLILIGYAFLTGGRAPAMRAAWMVAAACGGLLLRRPLLRSNAFALAWLVVAVVHPADLFNTGCQMSFLAVLVLIWALSITAEYAPAPDPLDRVIRESRPLTVTLLLDVLRWVGLLYLANFIVWATILPLSANRFHIVPMACLLTGPPIVLLSELALVVGFLQLLTAPILQPLAVALGWVTHLSLGACEYLVDLGNSLPGGYFFAPDVPWWWTAIFYVGLVPALTVPTLRRRWLWTVGGVVVWVLVSCWLWWGPRPAGSFRCTFLAVGHGGCTVIETASGRVLLYDTGALTGPDVTRRHIAPFLWQRGYCRIDEVVISHADADHFNGLPALLDFFKVHRITTTPFFAERDNKPVRLTLDAIERANIPLRQVKSQDRWEMDDVTLEVLHPPATTPAWSQNARSLVLRVEHKGRSLLLTGDLQDQGLASVLAKPAPPIDVLMAPHHGSKTSNTDALAQWARPKLVVSCQRRPKDGSQPRTPYEARGIPYLGTWPHGAVTIVEQDGRWQATTFKTNKKLNIR